MHKATRLSLKVLQTLPFGSKQLIFSNRNSSLNNYSTSLKKGNYPAPLTNHNNKTMKNLFAVKYYSTSTLLADNNTTPTTTTLDPTLFKNWTKEEVCSLLCTDEGKGGAGLSETKVQPLYDAGFKGTSIANIVTTVKDKDKYFAIEQLKSTYKETGIPLTVELSTTLQTVVNWVDNLLKTTIMITPENIKKARNDPLYDYLRNTNPSKFMEELEKKIGQNIPLPKFGEIGSCHVPKDYDPSIPYLLTRQRYEVLKKVIEREEGGFVLSGPFGISKSYTMFLLAAYAIVNSIPLLYVPKCGVWITKYYDGAEAMANDYLRSLVFLWNSDILTQDEIKKINSSVDVVGYMSENIAKNKPVFYLFDEHNELFRKNTEGKMAATENYFMDFTRWTSGTSGEKTMTVYCGSAHSSFEDYLPGGAISKIIRVVPPTVEEFKTLVEDFGLSLSDYNIIEYATGRIPRELKLLVHYLHENKISVINDTVIQNFMDQQQNQYEQRLYSLIKSLNKSELDKLFILLEGLFTLGLYQGRPLACLGIVYDKGLLYYGVNGKLYVINESAKRVLFTYYFKYAPIPVIPSDI